MYLNIVRKYINCKCLFLFCTTNIVSRIFSRDFPLNPLKMSNLKLLQHQLLVFHVGWLLSTLTTTVFRVGWLLSTLTTTVVSCWMVTINTNYWCFTLDGYYQHQLLVFHVGWLLSTPTTGVSRWMVTININYWCFALDGYYQH